MIVLVVVLKEVEVVEYYCTNHLMIVGHDDVLLYVRHVNLLSWVIDPSLSLQHVCCYCCWHHSVRGYYHHNLDRVSVYSYC